MARGATDEDPFAIFHAPPLNETPEERVAREFKESEAKRVSDEIDEQLKADRAAFKTQKNIVQVLLLGQAESGKSTTLKNFRMRYARDAWNAERASWRSVIQLNLVRSIMTIVDTLQAEMAGDRPSSGSLPQSARHSPAISPKSSSSFTPTGKIIPQQSTSVSVSSLLNDKHQLLQLRLGPLRRVESDLKRRFGEQAYEDEDVQSIPLGPLMFDVDPQELYRKEFGVGRLMEALKKSLYSQRGDPGLNRITTTDNVVDEVTEVIASCKDDMVALWSDPAVRTVLKNWNVCLEDSAGFFLNDVERIASRSYEPSDHDVVRARLRTLGVQEYKIEFTPDNVNQNIFSGTMTGVGYGREWRIYDVGGSRTMRHAWLPYFENAQAIIFLAPVSCFDQHLSEDFKVNRLEDSFILWQTICGSKLLAKANMIIFLNKIDLLNVKLRSGVKIRQYLPSYGDRSNDTHTMVRYLRSKFKDILKEYSTEERSCYFHATTVIDIKTTATTIHAVKDTILRDYLKKASFLTINNLTSTMMSSSRALQPVSAPLSSTPLPRLIYILTTLSVLLISYYSYRGLQYKSAVGGWWNGALGRRTPIIINGDESVEDRINGLARVLGIPSKELASAIAGAVRQNVPPASLSSITAKETGTVMESLLKMEEEKMPQAGLVEQVMNFGGMDDELD